MVEILSPRDETWEKLGFYGAHKVDQLLIVDLQKRRVDWLGLDPSGGYRALARSGLIELGPAELAERLDWPPASSTEIGGELSLAVALSASGTLMRGRPIDSRASRIGS